MDSFLAGLDPRDVEHDPFPHLVVEGALDPELYRRLTERLPAFRKLRRDADPSSNKRFNYMARDVLEDPEIDPLWKEFVRVHTSQAFLEQVVSIFGAAVRESLPRLEQEHGPLERLRAGVRNVDTHEDAEVLIDAMVAMNSPVVGQPSTVRGPHVDLGNKVFSALLYMREEGDDSQGGDLELYRFKEEGPGGFHQYEVDGDYVEYVKTVRYRPNTLIFFVNSIRALHGVTVRSVTPHPRRFACVVGQVEKPLFDVAGHQLQPAAGGTP